MSKKNKMMHAKLIVNPGAGNASEVAPRTELAVKTLKDNGVDVDVAFAAPKKEAIPIAQKAVKDGYDTIIVMGGDGTICAVIRGMGGSKTHLGIIPGGTMNDISRSLGIPEDVEEACKLIASDSARKMDIGIVKNSNYKKYNFFHVVAVGLTATIFPKVKKLPKGNLSQIGDAVSTLLKFESNPKVTLILDDESKVEVSTMLVTIANLPLIGAKNLVAPQASAEDGLLDVVVYPHFSKAQLLAYFARTANEGISDESQLQRYQAHKVTIKAEPKLQVAADGIKLGKGTATIKFSRHSLYVIAPPPVDALPIQIQEVAPALVPGD
jgi:diacylglycerol kinase (ATP)